MDVDDNESGDGPVSIPINDLRALRKAAKERDDLTAQMAGWQREMAFAKSKLDLEDPKVKYFVKAYEGDLTPEAIRTEAEAAGFFSQSQEQPQQQRGPDPTLNSQQRVANASAGAGETPNPNLEDMIKQAGSQEEVMKLMAQAGYPTSWSTQ